MHQELQDCVKRELSFCSEIECCYQLVTHYWILVKQIIRRYEFENTAEEIDFFKNCKPKFTSEIIYYELLYHFELFRTPEGIKNLLLREKKRLPRLILAHADFFDYYKKGETYLDDQYFLRCVHKVKKPENLSVYDEETTKSSHDQLIAQFIALEKYYHYLDEKYGCGTKK
jgi:hypothetical protein